MRAWREPGACSPKRRCGTFTPATLAGDALIAAAASIGYTADFRGADRLSAGLSLEQVAMLLAYATLMLGVCLLVCVVPTRRALSVGPTIALRVD